MNCIDCDAELITPEEMQDGICSACPPSEEDQFNWSLIHG